MLSRPMTIVDVAEVVYEIGVAFDVSEYAVSDDSDFLNFIEWGALSDEEKKPVIDFVNCYMVDDIRLSTVDMKRMRIGKKTYSYYDGKSTTSLLTFEYPESHLSARNVIQITIVQQLKKWIA